MILPLGSSMPGIVADGNWGRISTFDIDLNFKAFSSAANRSPAAVVSQTVSARLHTRVIQSPNALNVNLQRLRPSHPTGSRNASLLPPRHLELQKTLSNVALRP